MANGDRAGVAKECSWWLQSQGRTAGGCGVAVEFRREDFVRQDLPECDGEDLDGGGKLAGKGLQEIGQADGAAA